MPDPSPPDLVAPLENVVAQGRESVAADIAVLGRVLDLAGDFAVNLVLALIIFVLTLAASKWAASAARRILSRTRSLRNDPTVLTFAVSTTRTVVIIIGMIAVLQRLGVQTTSIIAILGAASLAIGLALQGTLSNVAAGVMLLVLRPYRVGDLVQLGGNIGTVQRLDLFTTQLSNGANTKIVVPNSKVLGDVILNLSGQRTRRVEIKFRVSHAAPLEQARRALCEAASAHPKVLPDPAPWAGMTDMLETAIEVTLRAWAASGDYGQVHADLYQAGKEALDALTE